MLTNMETWNHPKYPNNTGWMRNSFYKEVKKYKYYSPCGKVFKSKKKVANYIQSENLRKNYITANIMNKRPKLSITNGGGIHIRW